MTSPTLPASIPVSLRRLYPDASFVGCAEIEVVDATERSGECKPGCLFAALPGTNVHGRAFVSEAVQRGAVALLTDRPVPSVAVPQCVVSNVRSAYATLCHTLFAWPTRRLGTVGVTGTNGKSSVTWLVRSILEHAGRRTGVIGTIEYSDGVVSEPSTLTTPAAKTLASWLAMTAARGTRYSAIELSSHALHQGRAAGLTLDAAVVTNITQDHFDYHADFNAYRDAKGNIFRLLKRGGRVVLNADDAGSRSLLGQIPPGGQVLTFGLESPADVTATQIEETPFGARFTLRAGVEEAGVETSLIGRHNVSNCLAAAGAALHFGIPLGEIAAGIEALDRIPGRLERIRHDQPFQVYVDYAHTADALQRTIASVRQVTAGRVICVFGAGGDRDQSKRAPMGAAGSQADVAVVTSDNPRTEPPRQIIEDVLAGCDQSRVIVQADREQAIAWAIRHAEPGDAVIVTGKGHEQVQILGDLRIPFDDAAVCRRHLAVSQFAPHLERHKQPA